MKNNILVIGDAMLDSHVMGHTDRISPEAPVPVVSDVEKICKLGGAANVAAQVSVYADNTVMMYKITSGDPLEHNEMCKLLKEKNIYFLPMSLPRSSKTMIPVKERVWVGKQQICRIDRENTDRPTLKESAQWIEDIKTTIKEYGITKVIFSDYDKGTLTDGIIESIARYCNSRQIITVLDPKRPTFSGIKFLSAVKCNEKELQSTGLNNIDELSSSMAGVRIIQTRGNKSTKVSLSSMLGLQSSVVDVTESDVVDTCGCGDIHIAILTLMFDGTNILSAVRCANSAASLSAKHLGCYTLSKEEIESCIQSHTS